MKANFFDIFARSLSWFVSPFALILDAFFFWEALFLHLSRHFCTFLCCVVSSQISVVPGTRYISACALVIKLTGDNLLTILTISDDGRSFFILSAVVLNVYHFGDHAGLTNHFHWIFFLIYLFFLSRLSWLIRSETSQSSPLSSTYQV